MRTEEWDYTLEHRKSEEQWFFRHRCAQELAVRDKEQAVAGRQSGIAGTLEARERVPYPVKQPDEQGHQGNGSLHTKRELEVIMLVAEGLTNKQIAYRLHISEWTVATHLRRIFVKLGVESRAAMVHRCSGILGHIQK